MRPDSVEVVILMATFNGALYLKNQLQSIVKQTHPHWRLIIRDDGSSDNTMQIIKEFEGLDSRITLIEDGVGATGGAKENFAALMNYAKYELSTDGVFAFSDQDDVWHQDKLAKMLKHITPSRDLKPLLIHSDLTVVDENLELISGSFMKFQHLRHQYKEQLDYLVTQNFVTGCTCVFNKKLLDIATPIPNAAIMHDWWVALCAALSGNVFFEESSTILYRQHTNNTVGATGYFRQINPLAPFLYNNLFNFKARYLAMLRQVEALNKRSAELFIEPESKKLMEELITIFRSSFLCRIKMLGRLRLKRSNFLYKALFLIFMIFTPRKNGK